MYGGSRRRDDDPFYDPYDDFEQDWDDEMTELNFDEDDPRPGHRDNRMDSEERLEYKKQNTKKKKRRKERRDKHNIDWDD